MWGASSGGKKVGTQEPLIYKHWTSPRAEKFTPKNYASNFGKHRYVPPYAMFSPPFRLPTYIKSDD